MYLVSPLHGMPNLLNVRTPRGRAKRGKMLPPRALALPPVPRCSRRHWGELPRHRPRYELQLSSSAALNSTAFQFGTLANSTHASNDDDVADRIVHNVLSGT